MAAEKIIQAGPKKVAVLDAELYKNLKWTNQTNKQLESPQMSKVRSLDEQITEILENPTLSDFVKAKMYSETLAEYFKTRADTPEIQKSKAPPPPAVVPTPTPPIPPPEEEEVQEPGTSSRAVGPSQEERAQQDRIDRIWDLFLSNQDQLRVSIQENTGQLTLDGAPIVGSNIDSILDYVSKKRHAANVKPPSGTGYFLEAMGRIGLPPNLVPSAKVKALLRQFASAHKRHEQKGMGTPRKKRLVLKIKKWTKLFS